MAIEGQLLGFVVLISFFLLATGWGLVNLSGCHRLRFQIAEDLWRMVARASELAWVLDNRERLAEWQEISEQTYDEGTATVRAIHHAVAAIPFGVLEAIPATRDTASLVKGVHDLTAEGIYGGLSVANRLLGKQLRKKLSVTQEGDTGASTGSDADRKHT